MANLEDRLKEKLRESLASAGFPADEDQIRLLAGYAALLCKWNAAFNLTSVRDPEDMVDRHLIDSLAVSEHLRGGRFIDAGTGPGLPGIPLAIAGPGREFYLLDSRSKRISFIRQVKRELGIKNIYPVLGRCENFADNPLNKTHFDGILSRAFASLRDMLRLCRDMADEGTVFYAMKGRLDRAELEEIRGACGSVDIIRLKTPERLGERHLIIIGSDNRWEKL